ncbi:MAG TPA: DUF3019 domain-containing protein [Crenotrichaceae bacterium]|nr:DUF3019 domain-containing protein [Crenotrichaceae bacterium]
MRNNTSLMKLKRSPGSRLDLLILIVFIILIPVVQADSTVKTGTDALWKLWAKPRICVVPSDHRQCEMETDLSWVGSVLADICLLSSEEAETLHCWYKTQDGHLIQTIATETPVSYWLTRYGEDQILVETSIRIVNIPPRRVRRRRRHIWSLM